MAFTLTHIPEKRSRKEERRPCCTVLSRLKEGILFGVNPATNWFSPDVAGNFFWHPLSRGDLASSLITDAFIHRFKDELGNLNANRIHVELVKSQVSKGRVLRCLQLKEAHAGSPP